MKTCAVDFNNLVSIENLLVAWQGFERGKTQRSDVLHFKRNLMNNLFELHENLVDGTYSHGQYEEFCILDPKPRIIHKATVKDRVLHHAIFYALYSFYDSIFISDSYSSRLGKGVHRGVNRLRYFSRKATKNYHRTAWILQCDIRKYFASIDHIILLHLLTERINDQKILTLLENIISSFSIQTGKGIPLGNLTSQLFANIYLHELDQYVKRVLHVPFYIRYADDFVVLDENKNNLECILEKINDFLGSHLELSLHPQKVSIRTVGSGHDFLGWLQFSQHRVPRKKVILRARQSLSQHTGTRSLASYLGLISHGDTYELRQELMNLQRLIGDSD